MKKNTAVIALLCALCLLLTACGKSKSSKIEGFEDCTVKVSELSVPQNARLIALGEASHGNAEFQQLKLDVLKVLVENDGVRAFALEGDFGGCEAVNEYIHGGKGTALEAVSKIGFQIYRTQQMADLAQWMREYNEQHPDDELCFYGFDMQRTELNISGLLDFYQKVNPEVYTELSKALSRLYDEGTHSMDAQIVAERRSHFSTTMDDLEQYREEYIAASSELEYEYACQYVTCLQQGVELSTAGNFDYSDIRDKYMAENVDWILKAEALRGNDKVMLSGHNGHVSMAGLSFTNMGAALEEKYGESYFVIGTDFYKTTCNFPAGEGRANHSFKSADPLADSVKNEEDGMAYLSFEKAQTYPAVADIINAPMKMGSLGESYAWYMKLLPQSYRIESTPMALYDGMILVYKATPTVIFDALKGRKGDKCL